MIPIQWPTEEDPRSDIGPPCNQTTEHGPRSVSVLRKQFHGARSTEMALRGCFRDLSVARRGAFRATLVESHGGFRITELQIHCVRMHLVKPRGADGLRLRISLCSRVACA